MSHCGCPANLNPDLVNPKVLEIIYSQSLICSLQFLIVPNIRVINVIKVIVMLFEIVFISIYLLENISYLLERAFKVLERAFKVLERAFKVLERAFKVLERAFNVLERVFKVLERVFKVLERAFNVLKTESIVY